MSWLNGVFTRVHDWTSDRDSGIAILATRHDSEDDNLAAGINSCITKDGSNTPIVNLPMAGNRHTGCGVGVSSDDYATLGQIMLPNGSTPMTDNFDMGGNRVINAANGISSTDLVTKSQLDSAVGGTGSVLADGSVPLTSSWSIGGQKITGAADGALSTDYATMGQVFLKSGVVPMAGQITMGGNKITGMANGVFNSDAVTFKQMNDAIAIGGGGGGGTAVLANGTVPLTGHWAVGGYKLTNLGDGLLNGDAANIGQLGGVYASRPNFTPAGGIWAKAGSGGEINIMYFTGSQDIEITYVNTSDGSSGLTDTQTSIYNLNINYAGTSRDSGVAEGGLWSKELGTNNYQLMLYNGVSDVVVGGSGGGGKLLQTVFKNITEQTANAVGSATEIGATDKFNLNIVPLSSTSKLVVTFSWMGESTVPLATGFKFGTQVNFGVFQLYVPTGAGNNIWDVFGMCMDGSLSDMQTVRYEVVWDVAHTAGVNIKFLFMCISTTGVFLNIGNNRTIASPGGLGVERGTSFIKVQEIEL